MSRCANRFGAEAVRARRMRLRAPRARRCSTSRRPSAATWPICARRGFIASPSTCWWMRPAAAISNWSLPPTAHARARCSSILDETLTAGRRAHAVATGSSIRCSASKRSAPATTRSRSCSRPIWAAQLRGRLEANRRSRAAGGTDRQHARVAARLFATWPTRWRGRELLKRAMGGVQEPAYPRASAARISPMPALAAQIAATISDEPPVNPRDGNVIRPGFSAEVDELRGAGVGARGVIAQLEATERERTRIAVAQGSLQPDLRLLHRGHQAQSRSRARRLRAQADAGRRRALHHARTQGTRAQNSERRNRDSRNSRLQIFASLLRELAGAYRRDSRNRCAPWASSTRSCRWPRSRAVAATCARR